MMTTLLADNALSLVVELKDDTKQNSSEAVGLATYSNSESTALSYVSIFETLWLSAQQFKEVSHGMRCISYNQPNRMSTFKSLAITEIW
jgi:hypothetical protein